MSSIEHFSPDYQTARQRFLDATRRLGWSLEDHPIPAVGPSGETLALDVGSTHQEPAERVLVISSGLHGVEGFFGSAVQLALLEQNLPQSCPQVKCLFLHGINPFGFAWLRRFDEDNVDPNRNFLLPGETYGGSPADYAQLDPLLNPRRPPSRWEPFTLKALGAIGKYGLPSLRQTIAAGQYDFPQGLFFGGTKPSQSHRLFAANFKRWLSGSRHVVHLDFHTGLGAHGRCKLLIDYPLREHQRHRLVKWFGAGSFEDDQSRQIAYATRGGLGQWCVSQRPADDYLFACAEYGTFGPIRMLAGLRAENQAHHWGSPREPTTIWAKQRLRELFCPSRTAWRRRTVVHATRLVAQAVRGLSRLD